jgi:hypothetical protein
MAAFSIHGETDERFINFESYSRHRTMSVMLKVLALFARTRTLMPGLATGPTFQAAGSANLAAEIGADHGAAAGPGHAAALARSSWTSRPSVSLPSSMMILESRLLGADREGRDPQRRAAKGTSRPEAAPRRISDR